MKEEYTYEEILALDSFDIFLPGEICNLTAIIFETGRESKDFDAISKGLKLAEERKLDDFSDHEKVIFHFHVANGWSYLHRLTHVLNSNSFWAFETPEVENEIINLRKAIIFSENIDDPTLVSQVYTNLANSFDHIGRFVEAIQYWKKAITIRPGFGMAIGNLGFCLGHYAKILFDEGHRFLFCQYAYKYLNKASVSSEVYEEGQQAFKELAAIIEERYTKANLENLQDLNKFSLGRSGAERIYRQWCIDCTLFLNPLNDFIYENIVGNDCLFLPSMALKRDEPPFYHTLYNQLKQEFVSARYLYYQGVTSQQTHFSDKDNMQMDTLDYATYSLTTEKLKIAFRICYSLFDKIGYLLNSYLRIGITPKDVSFRKIWNVKSADKKNWELNPIITESQNWPLRGLYWISKDFIENDSLFSKSILPEAQQLVTIRNFMEHKSFKIVEIGETGVVDNGLTYQILRNEFEQKGFILLQMARSAIMNLSFAIHLEEIKKEKKPSIPVSFIKFDDQFKT